MRGFTRANTGDAGAPGRPSQCPPSRSLKHHILTNRIAVLSDQAWHGLPKGKLGTRAGAGSVHRLLVENAEVLGQPLCHDAIGLGSWVVISFDGEISLIGIKQGGVVEVLHSVPLQVRDEWLWQAGLARDKSRQKTSHY